MKFAILLVFMTLHCYALLAQGTEWGFELTLADGNKIELADPSVDVLPQNTISMSAGINYLYLSKSGFGIRAAATLGYHSQSVRIEQDINRMPLITYMPIGLRVEPVFRFKALQGQFEFFSGIEYRIYYSSGTSAAVFSNDKGSYYEFHFPVQSEQSLQPNVFGGISFLYTVNADHTLSIGLIRNVGLKSFKTGVLDVNNQSGVVQTLFASSSNYWGIRFMYSFK